MLPCHTMATPLCCIPTWYMDGRGIPINRRLCRVFSGDPSLERLTVPTMQLLQGGVPCVVQAAGYTAALLLRYQR